MRVIQQNKDLVLDTEFNGKFRLHRVNATLFVLENARKYITFILDGEGRATQLLYHDQSISSHSNP
jgi:hypothetical protein